MISDGVYGAPSGQVEVQYATDSVGAEGAKSLNTTLTDPNGADGMSPNMASMGPTENRSIDVALGIPRVNLEVELPNLDGVKPSLPIFLPFNEDVSLRSCALPRGPSLPRAMQQRALDVATFDLGIPRSRIVAKRCTDCPHGVQVCACENEMAPGGATCQPWICSMGGPPCFGYNYACPCDDLSDKGVSMLLPTFSETEPRVPNAPEWNTPREIKVGPFTGPKTPPESYQEERERSDSAPGARGLPSTYDDNDLLMWVERPPGYAGRRRTINYGDLDFTGGRDPLLHAKQLNHS